MVVSGFGLLAVIAGVLCATWALAELDRVLGRGVRVLRVALHRRKAARWLRPAPRRAESPAERQALMEREFQALAAFFRAESAAGLGRHQKV